MLTTVDQNCSQCGNPISSQYFICGDKIICSNCKSKSVFQPFYHNPLITISSEVCCKCHGTDLYTRWHPILKGTADWEIKAHLRDTDRLDEHLHHVCRNCGYGWSTDTKDKEDS